MAYNQNMVHALYRKLLTLYPQAFREQLGESMEQSFKDLCNERKHENGQSYFGFLLWMFVETAIGIFRERLLLITEGDTMQTILRNLQSSVVISFLTVLPFLIMELVNRQSLRASGKEDFAFPLFGILWFLAMLFVLIGMAILRKIQNVREGNNRLANLVFLLVGVVFLVNIVWAWGAWVIDQWPCFIGVPNCD